MNRLLLLLAAFGCLLLPSCINWAIGENIRASAEWRFAVDTTHRYRCVGDKSNTTIAPEVRFHDAHRMVDICFPEGAGYWPYGYEYTGRYRVLIERKRAYGHWSYESGDVYDLAGRELRRLPDRRRDDTYYRPNTRIASAGDKAQVSAVDGQEAFVEDNDILGGYRWNSPTPRGIDLRKGELPYEPTVEREPNYWLASAAAVPFDYLIDPVLEIVSIPLTPFWLLCFM